MRKVNNIRTKRGRYLRWVLPLAILAAVSAYFRFRPQPRGIDGTRRSYRLPAEQIQFFHDTIWYEDDQRQMVCEISSELIRLIRASRRWLLMDVFLFSLHHTDRAADYIPTTRQIVSALAQRQRPAWFITDPINTSFGSWVSAPLLWLVQAGVQVTITDPYKMRDNNLIYSPIWRLLLRWFSRSWPPRFNNLLEPNATMSLWSFLDAINARGNHRKLLIADHDDSYVSFLSSANFEDASSYFGNTAVTVCSAAVASHFLEAEKAVASMSGTDIPISISAPAETGGDAEVTPLMGAQIKQALVRDLDRATASCRIYLFAQFLSSRDVIEALVRASRRGVQGVLVLDQNKVDFGNPKSGYPNQITAPELARRTGFEIRWANSVHEEYHNQFLLLLTPKRCIFHVGSANYSRRSLSATVLEANIRIDAPLEAQVSQQVRRYAAWMARDPRSLAYESGDRRPSRIQYWFYRFLEASGCGTC